MVRELGARVREIELARGGRPALDLDNAGLAQGGHLAIATPTGYYFPPVGPGGAAEPLELQAALSLHPIENATVLHLHFDPASGTFVVGGQQQDPDELYVRVLARLGLVPGQPLVLVACGAGAVRADAAARLAVLVRAAVVAPTTTTMTTTAGALLAAETSVDAAGLPVVRQGHWAVLGPDGGQLAELPADLTSALRHGGVGQHLPGVGLAQGAAGRPPERNITWARASASTCRWTSRPGRAVGRVTGTWPEGGGTVITLAHPGHDPADEPRDEPAGASEQQDEYRYVIAHVRSELTRLNSSEDAEDQVEVDDATIISVYERLKGKSAACRDRISIANATALFIRSGNMGQMKGGGSGLVAAGPRVAGLVRANRHLLGAVNNVLLRWLGEGQPTHPIIGLRTLQWALEQSPPIRTDQRGMAEDIATWLASGNVTRILGGAPRRSAEAAPDDQPGPSRRRLTGSGVEPSGWAQDRPGWPDAPPEGIAWPPELNQNRIRQLVRELAEPAEGSSRFQGPQQAAEYAYARYRVTLDSGQMLMLEREVLLHQLTAGLPGGSHARFVRDLAGRYLADGAAALRPGADQPMAPETRGEDGGPQWSPALWLHNVRRGNVRPSPEVMWSLARMGLVEAPPVVPWQWGLPAATGGRLPAGTSLPLDAEGSGELIGHLAAPRRDGRDWTGPTVSRHLAGAGLVFSRDQLRLLSDLVLTRRYLAAVPAGDWHDYPEDQGSLARAVAHYLQYGTPFVLELGRWHAEVRGAPARQPVRAVLDDLAGQAVVPRWQLLRPALSPALTSTRITRLEQALARPGPGGQPWLAVTVADHVRAAWGVTLTGSQLQVLATEVLARSWLHGIPADTQDRWEQRRELHATAVHYILTGSLDDPPSLTWLPGDPRPAHPRPWLAGIRARRTTPDPAVAAALTRMGIHLPELSETAHAEDLAQELDGLPGRPVQVIGPDRRDQLAASDAAPPLPRWEGLAVNQVTSRIEYEDREVALPAEAAGVLTALMANAGAGGTGLTAGQLADAARTDEVDVPETVVLLGWQLRFLRGNPFRLIMQRPALPARLECRGTALAAMAWPCRGPGHQADAARRWHGHSACRGRWRAGRPDR